MPCHPPDRNLVEQIGVIIERYSQSARPFRHRQGQIELCPIEVEFHGLEDQSGEPDRLRFLVLEREDDLKQGRLIRRSPMLEFLDQLRKREILVGECVERRLADPSDQLTEGRVCRQVGPQRQCIDEEADQPLKVNPVPTCDRTSDNEVILTRVASKEHVESGQQGHEERYVLTAAQGFQLAGQGLREKYGVYAPR